MFQTSLILALGLASLCRAAPAAASSFSSTCSNIKYDTTGWILADCPTGSGTTKAAIYLYDKIANDDAHLIVSIYTPATRVRKWPHGLLDSYN